VLDLPSVLRAGIACGGDAAVFHKNTRANDPRGWGTQLENELGIILTAQRIWRAECMTYVPSRVTYRCQTEQFSERERSWNAS
jgi:hypothetical protein